MNADDWKTAILAFVAISTVAQWWVSYRNRRKDPTWLEVMKGQIRREIDADLKAQEVTLRRIAASSLACRTSRSRRVWRRAAFGLAAWRRSPSRVD